MARADDQYRVPRFAEEAVREALSDTRVVLLNGARQTGKSTLARHVAQSDARAIVRHLDDPVTLASARRDPVEFLRHDGLMVIDEVQRAPELVLPLKLAVDLDPRPGRFLLTGSAQVMVLRSVPDALTGRIETIELWPLSESELVSGSAGFIAQSFEPSTTWQDAPIEFDRAHYAALVARGGFPEAIEREGDRSRSRFFRSYLDTLVERDVRDISQIDQPRTIALALQVLAARTGMPVVKDNIARDLAVTAPTAARYISLLEQVFAIKRLPAWSSNATTRATKHAKLVFVDSGIASQLCGWKPEHLVHDASSFGPLLETFVISEIAKLAEYAPERVRLAHYRTRDKREVDLVLERPDGRVVGIEVKASSSVQARDFNGLQHFARAIGDRFVAGYVLYTGAAALPFGSGMRALPISSLWMTNGDR